MIQLVTCSNTTVIRSFYRCIDLDRMIPGKFYMGGTLFVLSQSRRTKAPRSSPVRFFRSVLRKTVHFSYRRPGSPSAATIFLLGWRSFVLLLSSPPHISMSHTLNFYDCFPNASCSSLNISHPPAKSVLLSFVGPHQRICIATGIYISL